MARSVIEVLAVAALRDHAPRRLVHLLAVLPGADEGERSLLRGQHGLVDVHHLRLARAGRERARAVGAVPAHERAQVEHDERGALDLGTARHGVGLCAVGACSDDRRERCAVGTELAGALLDRPGDLALLATGQPILGQPRVDRVADLAARTDQRDLVGVLDGAQVLDQVLARHELGPGRTRRLVQRVPGGVGQPGGLEADALAAEDLGDAAGDVAQEVLLDDLDVPLGGQRRHRRRVAEIRQETRLAAQADDAVGAGVTRQVADVRRRRDEEAGELALGQRGGQPLSAGDAVHAARSCSQS